MKIQDVDLKPLSVVYNDEDHSYTCNGKLFAGVSSVADLLPKPYLVQWAASECAKYIAEKWFAGTNYTREEIDTILKDAKTSHRRIRKTAADTGTEIHALLEAHIKGEKIPTLTDPMKVRAMEQFLSWERSAGVRWLASELLVANEDEEVAGRLDAVAIVNGKKTIVDFKVSKTISDSYYLQCAGYFLCLGWMGWMAEDRIIVRIPKTLTLDVYDRKTKKYNTVPNELEIVTVPTDLSFDCEVFLKLRSVYKWINQNILRR